MVLKEHFWFFESALPSKFCDEVVALAKQRKLDLGSIGKYTDLKRKLTKKEVKDLKKKRNSNIVFMNDNFLYNEICPFIKIANASAGWNFEWDWCESVQFTEYKKNQHYGWHCDTFPKPNDSEDINFKGKIRKLSCIVSLSDRKNYKGGLLEFDPRNYDPETEKPSSKILECKPLQKKGSIVVFPSHIWHRVKPITQGIRHSLVIWCMGYPFK